MKQNAKTFKEGVEVIKERVEDIKMIVVNNYSFDNEKMILNCKDLDEYYYIFRNRLRKNFKDVDAMIEITSYTEGFLHGIKHRAKYY